MWVRSSHSHTQIHTHRVPVRGKRALQSLLLVCAHWPRRGTRRWQVVDPVLTACVSVSHSGCWTKRPPVESADLCRPSSPSPIQYSQGPPGHCPHFTDERALTGKGHQAGAPFPGPRALGEGAQPFLAWAGNALPRYPRSLLDDTRLLSLESDSPPAPCSVSSV